MILRCEYCGKYTAQTEATYRSFWRGLCGRCGGKLRDLPEPVATASALERRFPGAAI